MDCLRKCEHKDYDVVPPLRNPIFYIVVTRREGSSFWTRRGCYAFVYDPAMIETKLASTLYTG